MRFHGLMLLRDEEDVIGECLAHLLTWIDALHIYDLGSTDATWDIVQDFARRDKRIIPFMRRPTVYSDVLRCVIFDKVRSTFSPGDFFLRLDADEFFHVPPPRFVQERMEPWESAAHLQWYYFRLTQREADAYESGQVSVAEDRKRSIIDRRRYYKVSTYAEPRMWKYRRGMQWHQTSSAPFNAGLVARNRLPILHYPHRDPEQMKRRYRLRSSMMKINPKATGDHWKLEDWRKDLVDDSGASVAQATKIGLADNSGVDTGPLLYWQPGTPLPEQPHFGHLPPPHKRLALRAYYAAAVHFQDRRQPPFDKNWSPHFITDEVNDAIGREGLSDANFPAPQK